MKKAPEVGSRWRFSKAGATYEVIEGEASREGYVPAKIVSATTDAPIGGAVELNVTALGRTYHRVNAKS
ncbi:MAG: hypothetical protein ACRDPE_15330 [Solirubrobacterales bacterium]